MKIREQWDGTDIEPQAHPSRIENTIRKRLHGHSFEYDTTVFPFRQCIQDVMGCPLGELHKYLGDYGKFIRSNDQSTLAHKVFYTNYEGTIQNLYVDFLKEFIAPIIGVPFYYQAIPTFRIGLPGNCFVGEYHKDSDYGHQHYEVNFNLGLAGYEGEAGLRTQVTADSDQFTTLECPYGEVFSFDHIDCLHGSNPNPNDVTMASFDFRLAIADLYYPTASKSVNTATEFKPGGYFSAGTLG
jgi:hypothetical protein